MRRPFSLAAGSLLLVLLGAEVALAAPPPRDDPWAPTSSPPAHPLWPTQIEQVTAPLLDEQETRESRLMWALEGLRELPDAFAAVPLARTLGSPNAKLRRMAAQQCLDRDLQACVGAATDQLEEESDPGVELMLLTIISRHPGPVQVQALIKAAFADDEPRRKHAIVMLGQAPIARERRDEVTRALVAKLGDGVAAIRSEAARSLGLVMAKDSSLALVRLLDDPDPMVRGAAAESLGHLGDPRTTGALSRALPRAGSSEIARSIVEAIALIPGDAADDALLSAFDDPPRHLSRKAVVGAIGMRHEPSRGLVDGLVRRLRDLEVQGDAVRALLGLGAAAVPALEAAKARGLEPALALRVDRLLAATEVPEAAPSWSHSGLQGLDVLLVEIGSAEPARRDGAGLRMALELEPDERARASAIAAARIQLAPSADAARPWLLGIVAGLDPGAHASDPTDALVLWTTLARWASDPGTPTTDRCLAALALGRAPMDGRVGRHGAHLLARLAVTTEPEVRACAVFAQVRRIAVDEASGAKRRTKRATAQVDAALVDPSPHVRAYAALATTGWSRRPSRIRTRLSAMRESDPHPMVQAAARLALRVSSTPDDGQLPYATPIWRGASESRGRWVPARVSLPAPTGASLETTHLRVWLPAPGGSTFVLTVLPPTMDAGPDERASLLHPGAILTGIAPTGLEGILDDETIDITIDIF